MTISIPDELQERLVGVQSLDWSAVACAAFESKLNELARQLAADRERELRRKNAQERLERRLAESVGAPDPEQMAYSRSLLLGNITDQAQWRDQKAEQYPGDERNGYSAEALRQLARHLSNIPANDPLWVRYYRAWDQLGDDDETEVHSAIEHEREELRTFGFHDYGRDVSLEDALQFLTNNVEVLEDILAGDDADDGAK